MGLGSLGVALNFQKQASQLSAMSSKIKVENGGRRVEGVRYLQRAMETINRTRCLYRHNMWEESLGGAQSMQSSEIKDG